MYIPKINGCPIKPLLEEMIYIAKKTYTMDFHHSSFNPPATEKEITELEKETHLKISGDYKDFLRFSNGLTFYGISCEFYDISNLKELFFAQKTEDFPSEYVMIADLVGDGEVLCFSKDTGKFLRYYDGREKWFDNFYDALDNIVSYIKELAEDYVEL